MPVWIRETGTTGRLKICYPLHVRIESRVPIFMSYRRRSEITPPTEKSGRRPQARCWTKTGNQARMTHRFMGGV